MLIIELVIIFIEQILILKLLELFCLPKRRDQTRIIVASAFLTIFLQILNDTFSKSVIVNILPFVFVGFYANIYLKGSFLKKCSMTLLVVVNILVINSIFIILGTLFNGSAFSLIYDNYLLVYMLTIASKIFLYLEYSYLKNYLNKEYTLTANAWKFIIIILILSFIAIGLTVNEFVNYKIHAYYVGIIVITFILVNLLIFHLCIMVSKHAMENANQKLLLESMWYETKLLETAQEKSKEISKVNHDFKHHILTVRNMIAKGNQEGANNYLNSLSLPETVTYLHTNNPVFNYILNDKIGIAKKKGIIVKYDILGEVPEYLENIDISIILGNLLDNAIEGCNEVDHKEIKIKITMNENSVVFNIRNSSKEVIMDKYGKIVTTKEDKRNHGFGMENIKSVVEKYCGDDFYSYTDGMFNHVCILNGIEE